MPLYIVSTPIGNLGDFTERAQTILKSVDIIAAEDTRHSHTLLSRFSIRARLVSYHDFNKEKRVAELISELLAGRSIAVISDAGTPGIADPCYHLVKNAIAQNIPVIPIPGASALLAALVGSGLPMDRFVFENFLPPKEKRRKDKLRSLLKEERTVILYESPYRILRALADMQNVLGDIPIVLAKELTKIHETFYRDKISVILALLGKEKIRGEFVILFNLRMAGRLSEPIQEPEQDENNEPQNEELDTL